MQTLQIPIKAFKQSLTDALRSTRQPEVIASAIGPMESLVRNLPAFICSQQSEDVGHTHTGSRKCSCEISNFQMNISDAFQNFNFREFGLQIGRRSIFVDPIEQRRAVR